MTDQINSKSREISTQLIARIDQQPVKISEPNSTKFTVKLPKQIRQIPEKQIDRNQTETNKTCIKTFKTTKQIVPQTLNSKT